MPQTCYIAIETSSRQGSVAIGVGPETIGQELFPAQTEHARDLLPALDSLCRKHHFSPQNIAHCYVSIGPGSFTGLRVAVACARALALAQGTRICAVPTLHVIALNCLDLPSPPARPAVLLNAKRDQVFGAVFEFDRSAGYRCIRQPVLTDPARLLNGDPQPDALVGDGLDFHREAAEAAGIAIVDRAIWTPRAACAYRLGWKMAQSGEFTQPGELVPAYIRRPEAEELWEKRVK